MRRKKAMRFDFLDLVQVKNHGHKKSHRGVVIQGMKSVFGETYHIQWPRDESIVHVEALEKFGS